MFLLQLLLNLTLYMLPLVITLTVSLHNSNINCLNFKNMFLINLICVAVTIKIWQLGVVNIFESGLVNRIIFESKTSTNGMSCSSYFHTKHYFFEVQLKCALQYSQHVSN